MTIVLDVLSGIGVFILILVALAVLALAVFACIFFYFLCVSPDNCTACPGYATGACATCRVKSEIDKLNTEQGGMEK